jgi:hypothetical protein
MLDRRHVLPLLEHKSRAAGEATALMEGRLPPVFPTQSRSVTETAIGTESHGEGWPLRVRWKHPVSARIASKLALT